MHLPDSPPLLDRREGGGVPGWVSTRLGRGGAAGGLAARMALAGREGGCAGAMERKGFCNRQVAAAAAPVRDGRARVASRGHRRCRGG